MILDALPNRNDISCVATIKWTRAGQHFAVLCSREKYFVEESLRSVEESQKKEATSARKVRKVAKCCFSGGSNSRLAKAAGARPCCCRSKCKIAHGYGAKHIFKSECAKHNVRATFKS